MARRRTKMKKDKMLRRAGFLRRERRAKPRCVCKRRAWELVEWGEITYACS